MKTPLLPSTRIMLCSMLAFSLLSTLTIDAQCDDSGSPCQAIRWERGGAWNSDGSINDSSNSGPINGVVRCANAAETQSNIQSTGCYHADDFSIDVSGLNCIDPSTWESVDVENPTEGQPIIWLNFDVRANGDDFEVQINDNAGDELGWALYYNQNPTNGTSLNTSTGEYLSGDLSCDQSSYVLIAAGSESSNTWNQLPIPDSDEVKNYFLALWDQDADGSLSVNNFKARNGCGQNPPLGSTECALELESLSSECNDDGTYSLFVEILASTGEFQVMDENALNGPITPICFSDSEALTAGTFELIYTQGIGYNISIEEVSALTSNGCPEPSNSADCVLIGITGSAVDCCADEIDCPEDESYQCGEEIPEAPSLNISEDCDDVAYVSFFETDLSDPSSSICDLETPGSADDGNLYWAITLPDVPLGISPNFIWDAEGATMSLSGNELLVTGTVVNVDDPNYRFFVHFAANAGTDWAGWNGQTTTLEPFVPRSYKDDAGYAAAGGDLWTTWDFYEVDSDNAYLIGEGALAGSILNLTHAPAHYLYGVQVGEAANTKTPDYGMASWFHVNGTLLGQSYSGGGDISTNADCYNPSTSCSYNIIRNWTVVYDSGEYTVCEQIVTIGDTQGPDIDLPADISIDCAASTDPSNTGQAIADDNCGTATLSYSDGPIMGECPSMFIRTWSAVDDCDNSSTANQVISLSDTTPPVFDAVPADEIYICGEEIPEAAELSAIDDCSSDISYSFSEVIEGNTSTDLDCILITAAPSPALGSDQEWSMFLQEQGSTVREYFILDENGATFTEIPLGGGEFEAHITGTVIKADGNAEEAFILDVWLIEKTDYDGWTGQLTIGAPSIPRQSKTFNGVAQPGDDLTWDYWILDSSRSELIGINDYAGDILALEHAPTNLLYAFEVGENANNYSPGVGIGGWFRYSGSLLGEAANGQGDFAFSSYCPPCEYTITRTWTATDGCGNSSTVTQVITVNETGDVPDVNNGPQSSINAGFVNTYPNPTATTATLVYRVPKDTPITLDILSRDGRVLNKLYQGTAIAGIDNVNTFDGSAYIEGLYIIRLTSASNVYYQKLILNR